MNWSSPNPRLACWLTFLTLGLAVLGFGLNTALVRGSTIAVEGENSGTDVRPLGPATQIECITPDGRVLAVPNPARNAPVTIEHDTIKCPLREGNTVFIIAFSKVGLLDRLTFVNENAAACGELTIAVSNYRLAADSPAWTVVDGVIPFARKRLFNLSLLGVEAKYVKLSFRVESSAAAANQNIPARAARSREALRFASVDFDGPSDLRSSRD